MGSRKAISKRLRFEIFDRDNFTCQYCGKQPPEVKLHVDHIVPVSKDGTDDPENLRTSCAECNMGKSARSLGKRGNDRDEARRAQEALEAVDAAKDFAKAAKARDKLRDMACNQICSITGDKSCSKASITGVCRAVIEFDAERVLAWLDQAGHKVGQGYPPNEYDMMRYFYGILRHVREDGNE